MVYGRATTALGREGDSGTMRGRGGAPARVAHQSLPSDEDEPA